MSNHTSPTAYSALASKSKTSLVLRIECLLVFFVTLFAFNQFGGNWLIFLVVFAAIDLSMIGYLASNRVGGITYNLGHSYIVPRVILLAALLGDIHGLLLFALIWNAHISLDRAMGYGLKQNTFQHTHLGKIGKAEAID
jgi:hypothetical protein